MNLQKTALLVIDVQQGFDDLAYWGGERNNPDAEQNIAKLLEGFRQTRAHIIHVRHSSTTLGSRLEPSHVGFQVKPEAKELNGETVIVKHVNSAFIGTNLEQHLRENGISSLVICGATTDHCCSTTTRMAANLGFKTVFIEDAVWTYNRTHPDGSSFPAELVHRVNVSSLAKEFAKILSTNAMLERLR